VPPAAAPGEARAGPSYLGVLARAALAGGLASSVSVLALHPLDTLKTRVQSTPGATIRGIARTAPAIGARGLYRGIIPAVGGGIHSLEGHRSSHLYFSHTSWTSRHASPCIK
jgi:Mitochondrial carrier protein